MATISGTQSEKVFQIKQWLGVNLSPYGDTKLKLGEAAVMRNFRITRDGNLQKRPGTKMVWPLTPFVGTATLYGAWCGIVAGQECVLVIRDDKVYSIWDASSADPWVSGTLLGTIDNVPAQPVQRSRRHIFGFGGKAYIFGYDRMYCYDGTTFSAVAAYEPLVLHNMQPDGSGDTLEQINKISPKRRVRISPPSTPAMTWQLPEKNLFSVDYAVLTSDMTTPVSLASTDLVNGTITFQSVLSEATDSVEIGYTAYDFTETSLLDGMKFTELYNGDQLNRAFAYGNGSNQAYYTGLNYNGEPDVTYWPDLNVMNVGDKTDSITNLIRYNSRLVAFTTHGTYSIQYGQMTLADGNLIAAFYVVPVHKTLGSDVPGTAQMVMNSPVVAFRKDVYSWSGNKYGNLSADERQAKRISDRVQSALAGMPISCCFDDNYNQEYYICGWNGKVIVWNYARDVWYLYDGLYIYDMFTLRNKTYFFRNPQALPDTGSVGVVEFDETYTRDDMLVHGTPNSTVPIDCYWESGSMDFGVDYQRKYSAMLWVGVMPASHADVWVTAKTDRSSELTEKLVAHWYSTFLDANFGKWSFNTSHRPRLKRLKIKAKKFVYYKLIFKSTDDDNTAVITTADIRVRFTGYAK